MENESVEEFYKDVTELIAKTCHNVNKAYGVVVNPKKSEKVTFTDKDKLIVIAED